MKTIEWLEEMLSNGQVLEGEVLAELLASYWHKSEMGQVDPGDERPVSGKAVALALEGIRQILEQNMHQMIVDALPGLLAEALRGYVTTEALDTALRGRATEVWVQQQLSDKVSQQTVMDALAEKVGVSALADKVTTAALEEALAGKVGMADMADALAGKADASAVYTKTQIDAAMSARPTQTESASETSAAINNAVGDLPNNAIIQQLTDKVNALVTRTNTLSHVACGSETMNACLMDIDQITRE